MTDPQVAIQIHYLVDAIWALRKTIDDNLFLIFIALFFSFMFRNK